MSPIIKKQSYLNKLQYLQNTFNTALYRHLPIYHNMQLIFEKSKITFSLSH